jgi:hypothetical protein
VIDRYRKSGVAIRLERWRNRRALVRLEEHGVAEEEGRLFRCSSSGEPLSPLALPDEAPLLEMEEAIATGASGLERLTIVSGRAVHSCGTRQWEDVHVRVHVALVASGRRVLLDAGGTGSADIDTDLILGVGSAVRACSGAHASGAVRLHPSVSAQIWPALILSFAQRPAPSPLTLEQGEHPGYGIDGVGQPIQRFPLFDGKSVTNAERWPNRFRPSYRVRPLRAAFHLRAELPVAETLPEREAIGTTTPLVVSEGRVRGELLCRDGALVKLDAAISDLRRGGREERWYPYAAGSWGAEIAVGN